MDGLKKEGENIENVEGGGNGENGENGGNGENGITRNIWNKECEILLAEWSEKASCYRWLHGRCEKSYKAWYYCFSIPVIILSTLTGAANVGMDSFVPSESKSMASAIVGGVNIFAGIISTLQNFLKVAELMEGHRIAGVSWGKLQRNIAIELALDPLRRVKQSDFLKISRSEYDRLIEAGPIIDDGIIKQFNKKFKNYEVSIPSICNGLDKCNIYKKDKSIPIDENEFLDGIQDIVSNEEKGLNKNVAVELDFVKVDKGSNRNSDNGNNGGDDDNGGGDDNGGDSGGDSGGGREDRGDGGGIKIEVEEKDEIMDESKGVDKATCTCNTKEEKEEVKEEKEEVKEEKEEVKEEKEEVEEEKEINDFLSGIEDAK